MCGESNPMMIPAHWLRLAGDRLTVPANHGPFVAPDDWTADEEAEFRTAVFAWLNGPIDDSWNRYDPEHHVIQEWMVCEFLGSVLRAAGEATPEPDDAFATVQFMATPLTDP